MRFKNIVLLLTSTINPDGMANTSVQDSNTRMSQYLEAIDFYLSQTECKIIVCENTGYDFYSNINNSSKYSRVEFLTFQGNNYNKSWGKDLGEVNIINHAICNSEFIKHSDFIIKITGRVKILNINNLIKKLSKISHNYSVAGELIYSRWISTVCIAFSKAWLQNNVKNQSFEMLMTPNYLLENYFYDKLRQSDKLKLISFYPIISGISGSFNRPYSDYPEYNYNLYNRKLNNKALRYKLFKQRQDYNKYLVFKFSWILYLIKWKFLGIFQ